MLHIFGLKFRIIFLLLILIISFSSSEAADSPQNISNVSTSVPPCAMTIGEINYLASLIKENRNFLISLDDCKKSNHMLFAKLVDIDASYFEYASDQLKNEDDFIDSFIIKNPEVLQYASNRIRTDPVFVSRTVRSYPEAIKYASSKLLNNKIFVSKMVSLNARNFIYVSDRLQGNKELARMALKEDGSLLEYAADHLKRNKEIVKIAVSSYTKAIELASSKNQKDLEIRRIANKVDYTFLNNFDSFLQENYSGLPVGPSGTRGYRIVNYRNFFSDYQIIDRPYLVKWELVRDNGMETNIYELDGAYHKYVGWKNDLRNYPGLADKINQILINNDIDQNTIDVLSLTSLWEISDDEDALAFNLYLLRHLKDQYLEPNFANVISLSVIAKKVKNEWVITIVNALFDANIKMDIAYKNGHKRYEIWDLFEKKPGDKMLQVLYKIEGRDSENFELFIEQPSGKFASVYKGGGYDVDLY